MAQITIDYCDHGTFVIVNLDTDEDILVQTDWDYPGLAMTFGWSPCHGETDGTVKCPVCGMSADTLIADAGIYLDDHIGDVVDDPGYFDNEGE